MGMLAALVLPRRSMLMNTRSPPRPSLWATKSMMRRLAWCGMSMSTSATLRPHAFRASSITSPMRVTASL
jgi:hypothetical protein